MHSPSFVYRVPQILFQLYGRMSFLLALWKKIPLHPCSSSSTGQRYAGHLPPGIPKLPRNP